MSDVVIELCGYPEVVEREVDGVTVIEILEGPPGPPGAGGTGDGGDLPNIHPAPLTATVLAGTVDRRGILTERSAAEDVASQTSLTALTAEVAQLTVTLEGIAAAFSNGVTGGQYA